MLATDAIPEVMSSSFLYGFLTGLAIFAAGFVLGTVRTVFLLPYMADWQAVLIEMPFILLACWVIIRHVIRHRSIAGGKPVRMMYGATAFATLLLCEWVMVVMMLGQSSSTFFDRLITGAGLIGLAGQLLIVVMPLWVKSGKMIDQAGK